MNYNDLRTEELLVEASAIRFYMRQAGWVSRGEVAGSGAGLVHEANHSETPFLQHRPQPSRQRNWMEWVRSL